MHVCHRIDNLRAAVRDLRAGGARVGFVPTMGALHAGHMRLVETARAAGDRVVASIFVNPAQFEVAEDLAKYPRTVEDDLEKLRAAGVEAVFLPEVAEIYPPGSQTVVEVTALSQVLVGKVRPGHFRGVTTVVAKLLNIVAPDAAYFGEKDYQQLAIIRQMVCDLHMAVEIVSVPIVRDTDGLALSSRNVRLTPAHRAQAPVLNRALDAAEAAVRDGSVTVADLRAQIAEPLAIAPDAQVEAIDIQDAQTLGDLDGPLTTAAVVLLAVRFGAVLLIDARVVTPA